MNYLDNLNPAQKEAVTHVDGPLLVVAGPGSGKTRVITCRIAHLIDVAGARPWEILAVTFTNKAAGEMKHRVQAMVMGADVHVSTFHSFGATFLRREAATLGVDPKFTIFDQSDARSLIRRMSKELGINTTEVTPNVVGDIISRAKNLAIKPADLTNSELQVPDERIVELYARYQQALRDNHAFDFDDLLLEPVKALTNFPDLRRKYHNKYRYILVDEYQDTNHVQYELTKLIGSGHGNVCVTGDPDQSIYSWRGADVSNILEFEKDFAGAKVVVLGQNYRSTSRIVASADRLVRRNTQRLAKDLFTENEDGPMITAVMTQDESHEASVIARRLRDLVEEEALPLSEIAIFYRTNAQSRAIEQAVREEGIPYTVIGTVEFYHRREIQDLLAWLKFLANPNDEIAFTRAIGNPKRGVGEGSIDKVIRGARELGSTLAESCRHPSTLASVRGKGKLGVHGFGELVAGLQRELVDGPVEALLAAIIARTGYEKFIAEDDPVRAQDRIDNIGELLSDAAKFDQDQPGATLGEYLERVALISDTDKVAEDGAAVSLMSLHAAKGLEFEAVFITGVEENLIPHGRAVREGPDDIEEERRLFYVGITRSKRFLTLTLAKHRQQFGQVLRNSPSRFFSELPAEHILAEDRSGFNSGFTRMFTGSVAAGASEADNPDGGDSDLSTPWDDADLSSGLGFVQGGKSTMRSSAEATSVPSARPSAGSLATGDRVRHAMFGIGRVVAINRSGNATRAKIIFEGWGEKNLALEFAHLERL